MPKPLTWNDLANLYDERTNNRKAKTLPMETVLLWVETQADILYNDELDEFYLGESNHA